MPIFCLIWPFSSVLSLYFMIILSSCLLGYWHWYLIATSFFVNKRQKITWILWDSGDFSLPLRRFKWLTISRTYKKLNALISDERVILTCLCKSRLWYKTISLSSCVDEKTIGVWTCKIRVYKNEFVPSVLWIRTLKQSLLCSSIPNRTCCVGLRLDWREDRF